MDQETLEAKMFDLADFLAGAGRDGLVHPVPEFNTPFGSTGNQSYDQEIVDVWGPGMVPVQGVRRGRLARYMRGLHSRYSVFVGFELYEGESRKKTVYLALAGLIDPRAASRRGALLFPFKFWRPARGADSYSLIVCDGQRFQMLPFAREAGDWKIEAPLRQCRIQAALIFMGKRSLLASLNLRFDALYGGPDAYESVGRPGLIYGHSLLMRRQS